MLGASYKVSDHFLAGLAGGYQRNKVDFRGTGGADVDSYSLSAYGRYEKGAFYVKGVLGASLQKYDMTRYYTPALITYAAKRSPDGTTTMAGLEAGFTQAMGSAKVEPFVGLTYAHTKIDGSTETGSGPGNLTVTDQTTNSTSSRLGVRLSNDFALDSGSTLTPMLTLGWRHAFNDTNPTATAALAGLPGSSFTISGTSAPKDFALVGAGLTMKLSDGFEGVVRYDGDFASGYTNSTASVKLTLKF